MNLEVSEWGASEEINLELLTTRDIEVLSGYSEDTRYFDLRYNRQTLQLVAKQYVGQCVVDLPDFGSLTFTVHPKVPIDQLMSWWCWSESLIQPLNATLPLETVSDLLDQLAFWLSERILNQARLGLLSAYREETEPLTSPRGQILIRPTIMGLLQGKTTAFCTYSERTQDIPDNQVLLWTLDCLRRSALKHPQARYQVQAAWQALQGVASKVPYTSKQCFNWAYHRLNQHYELIHQLCGMILSRLSVSEKSGAQAVATFMLPMNVIFEGAVAKGLQHILAGQFNVIAQEPHTFSRKPAVYTRMDLVIRDRQTNHVIAVLDTKYKQGEVPGNSDVYQVVAYSSALDCRQAGLLYPTALHSPLNTVIGSISTWSMGVPMSQSVLKALEPLTCYFLEDKSQSYCH